MKSILFFNLLILSFVTKAETEILSPMQEIQKISDELKSFEVKGKENLGDKLYLFRKKTLNYVDLVEQYCRKGVLGPTKQVAALSEKQKSLKMTKEQKKDCYTKLKKVQAELIQRVYFVQKKYLQKEHKNELERLSNLKKSSLLELDQSYKRFIR